MPERRIKAGILRRSLPLDRAHVDEETRTAELAFSSEAPVERWFGVEILDHGPGSVRLDRIRDGGPLLMDHNPRDHIGVVESVTIGSDRVARAKVRFGNSARAQEVFRDVLDGIRRHVSVGYRIHNLVLEEVDADANTETYRATDWEPYEISLVSVPADHTVGIGREADEEFIITVEERQMPQKGPKTPENTPAPAPSADPVDIQAIEREIREKEVQRVRELKSIGERFAAYGARELADKGIVEGWSPEQLRDAIMERLPDEPQVISAGDEPVSRLGLSQQEAQRYSLLRAINAFVTGDWSKAGYELECSREIAERLGRDARGFFVPYEVQTRVLNATTGGALIGTDHLANEFIDNLRARSVVLGLGARVLPDLQGNVDIPKKTASATFQWLADDGAVTDSDPSLGSVSLTPKTVAGSVPMSRRLLKQSSPAVEQLVQDDLETGAALAIDLAALEGTGTNNQPTGVVNTTGVSTQTVVTAGDPSHAELVGFETAVANANALMGSLAYVTTAGVIGNLKTTVKDAGSGRFLLEDGQANGYPVAMSNQLSANRIIFGNWADVLIGMWGVLDIMPDAAAKAASGGLVLRVFQDVDVAVRHPQSFCINA